MGASLIGQLVKNLSAMQDTLVQFLGQEDPLEKGQATHSSIVGLPSGSSGNESTFSAGDLGLIHGLGRSSGEGKGYPLQYSGLRNSMDSTVHGLTKSQTWLSKFPFSFRQIFGINHLDKDLDYLVHRTGKVQFSFQSQKRAMPRNIQTTTQLHSFHMLAR